MTRNRLLNIAIGLCKFIRLVYILIFIILTTVFVHFQLDNNNYEWNYSNTNKAHNFASFFNINIHKSWKIGAISNTKEDKTVFALSEITKPSLYINYLKVVSVLIFMFLSVKEFQKIMQSIMSFKTFRNENVKSFRRIGKYIFIIFLLSSYMSISFNYGGFSEFNISFTPLILMLIAFIMAEIFKEGLLLKQENDLTI